jgi:tetratricopeptide (TPR) repeat protein
MTRTMSKRLMAAAVAIVTLLPVGESTLVQAAENPALKSEILRLAHDWERVKFQVDDRDERERQMAILAQHAADIAQRYQNVPESVIWVGIIISEQASMASENGSPIKALELAKRARDILEQAEKIDPVALDAAAPTTLGVLYDRVPGFPIGFGDKSLARHYLHEAIVNAPNGLDANSFYGEFLYDQHEFPEAVKILKRALTLPALPDRPIWDRSRRLAIQQLLTKMQGEIRP